MDKIEYNKAIEKFYGYLSEILKLYQDALPILKQELESIEHDDIPTLNEMLKSQQTLLLQTKSFDKDIAKHFSILNISGENLTAVIQQLPTEEHLKFYALLGQFELTMKEVNFYKEKCRILLESKLYGIEKILSTQTTQKDNTTYNRDALEIQNESTSKTFKTKV